MLEGNCVWLKKRMIITHKVTSTFFFVHFNSRGAVGFMLSHTVLPVFLKVEAIQQPSFRGFQPQ